LFFDGRAILKVYPVLLSRTYLSAQLTRQNFSWERNEKINENLTEQVYKIPDTPIEQLSHQTACRVR
jgi:hypothetical protein